MVNYVPLNYDISDTEERVQWLIDNDDKAQKIAKAALELSHMLFSPQFQEAYIRSEFNRVISNGVFTCLQDEYEERLARPSDINEHMDVLRTYALKCKTVVDLGKNTEAHSLYAYTMGLKDRDDTKITVVRDSNRADIFEFIINAENEGVKVDYINGTSIKISPINTDILHIDTWHVYGQLKRELEYWNSSVKGYIIMHDTTIDELVGESVRCDMPAGIQSIESGIPINEIRLGLGPAINEFIASHPEWKLDKKFINNNGLTILKRVNISSTD
jgi:hypothetical protein